MPLFLLALALFGLSYRIPAINRLDQHLFLFLHRMLSTGGNFFRVLWPLGTTPLALVLLAALTWPLRAHTSTLAALWIALGIAALLERAIKLALRRPRPFASLSGVHMLQPRQPHDPSYPSGDALRVWFLALAWGRVYPPAALPAAALAVLVSLGRIALGVHHPLDVLSGSALGALSAWVALQF